MALSSKSEALKHVPWFSLSEWHRVYKQIYSNDTLEQTAAYETLLVWKAREWKEKIDEAKLPMYYESDLRLMYSTTIMRFLNQISNIGHTKQTSMFQIAKQLEIPEWIVNLRHDAAHGHELPSLGSLRMAANILLTWLHEEYWSAEAKAMDQCYKESAKNIEDESSCEYRALAVFFELWIAIGLYAKADYKTVRELPDTDLCNTLLNLCKVLPESPLEKENISGTTKNQDDYLLSVARNLVFTEISTLLNRNKSIMKMEEIIVKILFDCEAFLPGSEITNIFQTDDEKKFRSDGKKTHNLPTEMIDFWRKFILLLHDKKLLDGLIWRLFDFVNSPYNDTNKRFVASLWLKSIFRSLLKLRIIQGVSQSVEHTFDNKQKGMSGKQGMQKVRDIVHKTNPALSNAMWLNASSDIPMFLKDINFATELLLNPNMYSKVFIDPMLDLVTPSLTKKCKDSLLKLVKIITTTDRPTKIDVNEDTDRIYCVEDLIQICGDIGPTEPRANRVLLTSIEPEIADRTIRTDAWEIASGDYEWAYCSFGILPWQIDSVETLELSVSHQSRPILISKESTILPGLLDEKLLTTESRVNWDLVLRKKKRMKRKRRQDDSEIMIEKAIEVVKKRQK
ncbi:uncharacterized protein [Venturia canescens]|uniref:uncharacterized protein isoform X2 n=1 Tax=Venturia canescens TaxID=32260 RepID=UPI001C9D5129|nr:uncharacterized protein LOC122409438 isoform X2 [Venturia canescens]